MATTCGFSSGWSSGFDVCVAEEAAPVAAGGGGVGAGQRLRRILLRPVYLEGRGLVTVLGRGELSAERALAGVARIEVQGTGLLSSSQSLAGAAQIVPVATAQLSQFISLAGAATIPTASSAQLGQLVSLAGAATVRVSVSADLDVITHVPGVVELEGATLMVATVAFGSLHRAVACAGMGSHTVTASGAMSAERSLEGWADESVSAWGDVEADDEETVLMVLGLPNEMLV